MIKSNIENNKENKIIIINIQDVSLITLVGKN